MVNVLLTNICGLIVLFLTLWKPEEKICSEESDLCNVSGCYKYSDDCPDWSTKSWCSWPFVSCAALLSAVTNCRQWFTRFRPCLLVFSCEVTVLFSSIRLQLAVKCMRSPLRTPFYNCHLLQEQQMWVWVCAWSVRNEELTSEIGVRPLPEKIIITSIKTCKNTKAHTDNCTIWKIGFIFDRGCDFCVLPDFSVHLLLRRGLT